MRVTWAVILLSMLSLQAEAALLSRASGLAYYDTATGLTWVRDGLLSKAQGYDADGFLTWSDSVAWIAYLNAQNGGLGYLGTNAWRLPTWTDLGAPGCQESFNGTDCGWNVNLASSEAARLYYGTLGNSSFYNTDGTPSGCNPNGCGFTGPFINVGGIVWAGGTSPPASNLVTFDFQAGEQLRGAADAESTFRAWAVTPGDVLPVNLPGDTDGDAVLDAADNCRLVSNPTQCDSDADGFGNRCDGDLNNNNATNAQDSVLFRQQLGQPSVAPTYNKADINCSGSVNAQDTTLFRQLLGAPPGPGAAP